MTRVVGWVLLMLFTGLATAWLHGLVDPLLPAGDWHGMLSGLFVAVTWPSLTWSLRGFAGHYLFELLPGCHDGPVTRRLLLIFLNHDEPGRLAMRALAVLAFVLISSTSFAATSERFSRGGWYKDFQPEIARANSSGELFRVKGHCQSNCTLFLGLRNVCVERSATLLFHAGHDRQRNIHVAHTQRMLSAYNAKLRKYLIDNHYMETLEFHAIPGSTIIDRFGYRECPRQ